MMRVCVFLVVLGLVGTAFANMNSGSGDSGGSGSDQEEEKCSFSSGSSVTIKVGASEEVNCVVYKCELVNDYPQLKRTSEMKCALTFNGTQHCLTNGQVEACTECVINGEVVTYKRQCNWNGGCVNASATITDSTCRDQKCNPTTYAMDTQPQNKCLFRNACYEAGGKTQYDCTDYTCDGETWEMKEDKPKEKCNYKGACIGEDFVTVKINNVDMQCKCKDHTINQLTCQP